MNITCTAHGSVTIATLDGRLAGDEPARTKRILKEQLQRQPFLVVDCRALSYMDSSGLGCLISCLRTALRNSGDLRLAGLSSKVRMLLELTRADQVFRCYPDTETAIDSFLVSHHLALAHKTEEKEEAP